MKLHLIIELNEDQVRQLSEKNELTLHIQASNHQVEILETGWPNPHECEPAKRLINILRTRHFKPEELGELSKNRVQKLLGLKYDDKESILNLEEALGVSFVGPFWHYATDLSQLFSGHTANALARACICTEADLKTTSYAELYSVNRLGRKSIELVESYYSEHGLKLT